MQILFQNRWWVYQRERFPVVAHGLLIGAFSFSAISYSWLLRDQGRLFTLSSALSALLSSFLFFLLLRIADEFKDFEDDSRFRPYRPVPRGLVTLRELAVLAVLACAFQLLIAVINGASLIFVLLLVWAYLALMSKEFFVARWLKSHPTTYMWSHMLIMPLIDCYATAFDWMVSGASIPHGLHWFLLVSFFNGIVIEVGRKIRAPQDEEYGVETYSALWGIKKSIMVWSFAVLTTALFAMMAANEIQFFSPVLVILGILLTLMLVTTSIFLLKPSTKNSKWIETFSGIWTVVMYLSLGVIPLLWKIL